jgi:hypothetical protein
LEKDKDKGVKMIPPNIRGQKDIVTLVLEGENIEITQVKDPELEIIAYYINPKNHGAKISPKIQALIKTSIMRGKGNYGVLIYYPKSAIAEEQHVV